MLGREFFAQLSQHFYGPTFLRFNIFTSQYFYNYGIYNPPQKFTFCKKIF